MSVKYIRYRISPELRHELEDLAWADCERPTNENADRSDKALLEVAAAAQLIRMAGKVLEGTRHYALSHELERLGERVEFELPEKKTTTD